MYYLECLFPPYDAPSEIDEKVFSIVKQAITERYIRCFAKQA